jgi:hypothetical protein
VLVGRPHKLAAVLAVKLDRHRRTPFCTSFYQTMPRTSTGRAALRPAVGQVKRAKSPARPAVPVTAPRRTLNSAWQVAPPVGDLTCPTAGLLHIILSDRVPRGHRAPGRLAPGMGSAGVPPAPWMGSAGGQKPLGQGGDAPAGNIPCQREGRG